MILEKKNLQTVQGLNKFYTKLIVFMETQKIAIILDDRRLRLENKFFLDKITQLSTYDHLYFILG